MDDVAIVIVESGVKLVSLEGRYQSMVYGPIACTVKADNDIPRVLRVARVFQGTNVLRQSVLNMFTLWQP